MCKLSPDSRWFTIGSWSLTGLIVLLTMGYALWRLNGQADAAPVDTSIASTPTLSSVISGAEVLPALTTAQQSIDSIRRKLILKTNIPEDRPRYETVQHTVTRGDSIFAIAQEFNIKPETVLWANYETLNDSPDSLRVGQVLNVPPVDGVYYQWKEGDTLESVANAFEASVGRSTRPSADDTPRETSTRLPSARGDGAPTPWRPYRTRSPSLKYPASGGRKSAVPVTAR